MFATKVRFGPFELDPKAGELWKDGRRIRLQEKPLKLLVALLEQPRQIVTREELRARLWPPNMVVEFDNGLNNAANKLRAALGDSANAPEYIETVGRRGYRFIGPLEPPAALAVATGGSAAWAPARTPPAAPVVPQTGEVGPRPRVSSLAVLPLANLSSDPEQEYFSDGMTDALISQLAGIRSLRIISRQSVMRFKHSTTPMPAIARELGVDGIIEGTVLRAADRIRISVQLIHAPIDSHLWSAQYERPLDDVLDLQAEIARAVVHEVRAVITPREAARLTRPDSVLSEAYDLYLRGRFFWGKRSEEALQRALDYFERAIAIEPHFARAHAAIAHCYGPLGYSGFEHPAEAARKMRAAAERALAIDPDLVEGLTALAACSAFHEWNWAEGERCFLRALEVDRNYVGTYMWYGAWLENQGRQAENLRLRRRAYELDPLNGATVAGFARALFLNGRIDDAIAVLHKTIEIDPDHPQLLGNLAEIYISLRRYHEAIELHRRAGTPGGLGYAYGLGPGGLGYAYGLAGRRKEARDVLTALERRARERYVAPHHFALVQLGLGEVPAALDALERGVEIRDPGVNGIKVSPAFASLADEPRFRRLLERIGLAEETTTGS